MHDGHQDAVQSVRSGRRFEADRRSRDVSSSSLRILCGGRGGEESVSYGTVKESEGEGKGMVGREGKCGTYELKMRFLASWRAVTLKCRVVVERWKRLEVGAACARAEHRRAVVATIVSCE